MATGADGCNARTRQRAHGSDRQARATAEGGAGGRVPAGSQARRFRHRQRARRAARVTAGRALRPRPLHAEHRARIGTLAEPRTQPGLQRSPLRWRRRGGGGQRTRRR